MLTSVLMEVLKKIKNLCCFCNTYRNKSYIYINKNAKKMVTITQLEKLASHFDGSLSDEVGGKIYIFLGSGNQLCFKMTGSDEAPYTFSHSETHVSKTNTTLMSTPDSLDLERLNLKLFDLVQRL